MDVSGLHPVAEAGRIAIGEIAELATPVATSGALRIAELVSDQMFEYTVAVVVIVGSCGS